MAGIHAIFRHRHPRESVTLATRLILGLSLVVATVMTAYGITSLRQREELISAGLAAETATLAEALQVVANSALRNGQIDNLDRVLHRILRDSDVAVSVVVDGRGRVLAGGPEADRPCIASLLGSARSSAGLQTWEQCGGRVRAIALPVEPPGSWLLLARRTTTLDRDRASSRGRIAATTVILTILASAAIMGLLKTALTRPLAAILAGVRRLGGPGVPGPLEIPPASRELQELAHAFNEMVERLEGKRQALIRETEERVELEQRVRRAETFAAIGRLAGGLAHEIGSPLGVIGMRAEAIRDDPSAPPAVRDHAAVVSAEVERIASLVRDLLHVAQGYTVQAAPVDLRMVVRTVSEAAAADAASAGTVLQVRTPDHPVPVSGDAVLLRHAVNNLVVNALHAVRPAGRAGRVEISLQQRGEVTRIGIVDNGPGIPQEQIASATHPFYTTKDVGEGSGLGLAITSGIVEEHGGLLTLVPGKSSGLCAYIDLPAVTAEADVPGRPVGANGVTRR